MTKEMSKEETLKMKDSLRTRRDSQGNIVVPKNLVSHDKSIVSPMQKAMLKRFDDERAKMEQQ